jgi:decaprenylphospho-beta-D-erythro-pentofuranosid-2-ulose 2-reductase
VKERMKDAGRVAVFGATSGIAREVSREFLRHGRDLVLIGRDEAALRAEAADLAVRSGRECPVFVWDLLDRDNHARRFAELTERSDCRNLGGLLFAAGVLFPEHTAEDDAAVTRRNFDMNLTETVVVLNLFARHFRARKGGFLSVLSSVAGDRGRAVNKTYGASKAGLSAYLEGLRAALHGTGVLVQTVKPGPVRTPMTAGYKGPAPLLADPRTVGRAIVHGIERGKTTIYTPGYWRAVMAVIRALPEFLARRVPG